MDDMADRICLPRLPAFKENTFCVDQADTDTAEYVRADLHQKAQDRIEELEAKLVRYTEVVGDKINLRAENAELKAEVGRLREVLHSVTYWSRDEGNLPWCQDIVRAALKGEE